MSEDLDDRIAVYLAGGWGRARGPQRESEGEREWYAVRAAPQQERTIAAGLAERNFAFFLPMETDWHGQPRVRHMEPLLPGYVFVLCEPEDFADLHGLEGVAGFVRYNRDDGTPWPVPFPARAILGLQMDERAGAFDRTRAVKAPKYRPRKGERVQITAGTYLTFFATVLAAAPNERFKLAVEGFDKPRHKTLNVAHLAAA